LRSDITNGSKKYINMRQERNIVNRLSLPEMVCAFEMPRNVEKSLGRRRRWKGNIQMNLLGIRHESVRQIRLTEGRGHLTAFVCGNEYA
jgi:hypothetical protein